TSPPNTISRMTATTTPSTTAAAAPRATASTVLRLVELRGAVKVPEAVWGEVKLGGPYCDGEPICGGDEVQRGPVCGDGEPAVKPRSTWPARIASRDSGGTCGAGRSGRAAPGAFSGSGSRVSRMSIGVPSAWVSG